jgi:hypothetical protein
MPLRLTAGGRIVIHDRVVVPGEGDFWQEYTLPAGCCDGGGNLTLTWQPWGRVQGVSVHELFLIPEA